ncbi:MAG: hypothetical protein RJA25_827 [Bacteroidota bacterium]|jgi:NADP-dependent 3-hydroxy acid dehydrogenase YdfG
MQKKIAIVSGASGSLGKAVVHYFINENYYVIGLVHHFSAHQFFNSHYEEIEVDLCNEIQISECVDKIILHYNSIDTVVLTAGGFAMGNINNTTIQDIQHQYKLNFETAYNLVRPVLAQMEQQGKGRIFFIGSGAGMDTRKGKGVTAYSLSKSLLFQLANIINAENEKTNIYAQVIVPSIIDTPPNREAMPNADFSKWEKPEKIAEIIGYYNNKEVNNEMKLAIIIQDEL